MNDSKRDSVWDTESLALLGRLAEHGARLGIRAIAEIPNLWRFVWQDPMDMKRACWDVSIQALLRPLRLARATVALWQDIFHLVLYLLLRLGGLRPQPVAEVVKGDFRFRDQGWDDSLIFDAVKQTYLIIGSWIVKTLGRVDGADPQHVRKVQFFARQIVDALAPSNFPHLNPEVLRTTLETRGANLKQGLMHIVEDLDRSPKVPSIKMTDLSAFEVGRNLAVTPGKVIFQNELLQLIQYDPQTENVATKPMLFIPPPMNKFYVLDLRPENSLARYLVEHGLTVFMISWVNPDESLAHKTFDDYILEGIVPTLDAIETITGESEINVTGYCFGGIFLACTMAYLKRIGIRRIHSATFFTTMIDFSDVGDVSVFLDEKQFPSIKAKIEKQGYLDGADNISFFRWIRARELVWSFFVNNYLLGRDPGPFDILYWNSDPSHLPAAMHLFFMEKAYIDNVIKEPNGISIGDQPLDLREIDEPTYFVSAQGDHIAPWKTTFEATKILSGPITFVLAQAGHINGIINPPAEEKYGYWTHDQLDLDADAWLDAAQAHDGSWWPHWIKWLEARSGDQTAARIPGAGPLETIEDAPGSYVKERISDQP